MKKKFHIVWNEAKSEGFITDSEDDAEYASTGMLVGYGTSPLAYAMRETYAGDLDDDEGVELPVQAIEIEVDA